MRDDETGTPSPLTPDPDTSSKIISFARPNGQATPTDDAAPTESECWETDISLLSSWMGVLPLGVRAVLRASGIDPKLPLPADEVAAALVSNSYRLHPSRARLQPSLAAVSLPGDASLFEHEMVEISNAANKLEISQAGVDILLEREARGAGIPQAVILRMGSGLDRLDVTLTSAQLYHAYGFLERTSSLPDADERYELIQQILDHDAPNIISNAR